jgi:hypothetical protein
MDMKRLPKGSSSRKQGRWNPKTLSFILAVAFGLGAGRTSLASSPTPDFYSQGVEEYNAGHMADAIADFDKAIKHHQKATAAQQYIDRIRKETVEKIRNRALAGISKSNWQSKFYFMNTIGGRLVVGISSLELFEPDSLNFREGAVDALQQLAGALRQNQTADIEIQLIMERPQDTPINADLTAQRLSAVFSYLSLASQGVLPKYGPATVAP